MRKHSKLRKKFFTVFLAITVILSYACISYASKHAGTYWYSGNSDDGVDGSASSGYVVVDAIDSRDAIGPFKGGGPSFSNDEVEMQEEEPGDGEAGLTAVQPDEVSGDWKILTVKSGETLSKLSETHGISIENIMKANELADQHRLREGQKLYMPNSAEAVDSTLEHVKELKGAEVEKLKQAPPMELTDYMVKNGDTLWSIANKFNLDFNSLLGCNKISEGDVLKVGSTVKVPNQDGILITVRQGHTVEKLAKEYSIYPEAIKSANSLADASLKQGAQIFLPGAKVAAIIETGGSRGATASNVKSRVTVKGGFGWPVSGKISSGYGMRRDPIRRATRDFHTGIDIRAPRGRTVVASAAGKVVHSGRMGGYGLTIVISHPGGVTTLYGHCSKLLVKTGTSVKRGQAIAQVGSTGRSTGNHLHFEVRSGGSPMNPLKVLR
jgi:murein DD-endopeptidase MepM/ murein hydrolase activator NlpD